MLKRLSTVAALALAAMALLASTAMAEIKWSHSSATFAGSLTFKRNGADPKTCTFNHSMDLYNGPAWFRSPGLLPWEAGCSGSTIGWAPEGEPEGSPKAGYSLQLWDWMTAENWAYRVSPWSGRTWLPASKAGEFNVAVIPYTNGTSTTSSKVTFNNTHVGETNLKEAVTATGTLTVKSGAANVILSGE